MKISWYRVSQALLAGVLITIIMPYHLKLQMPAAGAIIGAFIAILYITAKLQN